MQYTVKQSGTFQLGRQGEHRARELPLPEFAAWEKKYGPGEAEIIFLPPGKKTPHSVTPVRTEDGPWLWSVTAKDTACPGYGKCELRYTVGGTVLKSAIHQTFVAASLGEGTSIPEMDTDGTQREESPGMTTFNGRAGAVMPQAGDYTAAMVGAATPEDVSVVGEAADTAKAAAESARAAVDALAGKMVTTISAASTDTLYPSAKAVYDFVNSCARGSIGSIITVTFDAEFAGQAFTVSDGADNVNGVVPEGLAASVNVVNCNSTYTITAEINGLEYSTAVTTGPYFGQYTAALTTVRTYGVRWEGGPETTMSRTDYARGFQEPDPFVNDGKHPGYSPFDGLMPWAGMRVVDDPVLGSLVSIPKYWYKWTKNGAVMTLQISDKKQDGFFVSPAHADRADGNGERDIVYAGRYHCDASYMSKSGSLPVTNITRDSARKGISALHTAAWQHDFAMQWTIWMLYLVEFANWNSQNVIGYGAGIGVDASITEACGASDKMGYHTGTMQAARDTYGTGCQYRWIEGLWENCFYFVDGIYFQDANIYCIKTPSKFSETANGTLTGTRPMVNGFIKSMGIPSVSGFEWALYPSEVGGDSGTYIPDLAVSVSGNSIIRCGACHNALESLKSNDVGLFFCGGNISINTGNVNCGCRLMKLP